MKKKNIRHLILGISIILIIISFFMFQHKEYIMIDFSKYSKEQMVEIAKKSSIELTFENVIDDSKEVGTFISQSVSIGKKYKDNIKVIIKLSKKEEKEVIDYASYKVNELGLVPIMMYHGIYNLKNDDTKYTGGNVDKDGYNRTTEAFINDLEMYYQSGYRMIRLIDYINGNINVKLGYSPIILTLDDGIRNNINILGKDDKGKLIIDPTSAVGILESFKDKYPDFNVTATFFLNSGLFAQKEYNEDILKWLVDNGYDIGNHTRNHTDLSKTNSSDIQMQISYMYKMFDQMIPSKYVNILALPYGAPGSTTHANFSYIMNGEYEGYKYSNKGILKAGWDSNSSPFDKNFNPLYMKRVRAYDNNGKEFDIEMVFKSLENTRYISDGNSKTIVVRDDTNIKDEYRDKIIKY